MADAKKDAAPKKGFGEIIEKARVELDLEAKKRRESTTSYDVVKTFMNAGRSSEILPGIEYYKPGPATADRTVVVVAFTGDKRTNALEFDARLLSQMLADATNDPTAGERLKAMFRSAQAALKTFTPEIIKARAGAPAPGANAPIDLPTRKFG